MSTPRPALRNAASLLAGTLFGAGLAVSQMTDPAKILAFLDVTGDWDPSLLLVMGGAVAVSTVAFRWILKRPAPLLDTQFDLPQSRLIDGRLLAGAAVFGIGWGLAGYCPGPAVASVAFANPEALWVLPAIAVGTVLQRLSDRAR